MTYNDDFSAGLIWQQELHHQMLYTLNVMVKFVVFIFTGISCMDRFCGGEKSNFTLLELARVYLGLIALFFMLIFI